MAVTGKLYSYFFNALANKEIDLVGTPDSIYVMLTTSTYTPDQDVHDYYNDVTNEVSGTGYSANGAALASITWTYTSGTNTWAFDAADTSWTTATITARNAIVYDRTPGTDATRPLICYQASDADITSTAGTWTITWNASGIFTIVVS